MKIQVVAKDFNKLSCDILLIHVFEEHLAFEIETALIDTSLAEHISAIIAEQGTCSQYGKTTLIHTWGTTAIKRILLVGMGKKAELTIDKIRFLYGNAMRIAQKSQGKSIAALLPKLDSEKFDPKIIGQAITEGALLGTYQFNYYKTTKSTPELIESFTIIATDETTNLLLTQGVAQGKIIGKSVNLARDLGNHPAIYMTPSQLANQAQEIAEQTNLELMVLEQRDMEQEQMHALLAVAKGSAQPPKMIVLKYWGDPTTKEITAFVGKGVTFDSGGISIKPSANMGEMKNDMAGGAAVLSAMLAIGKLKPTTNILGIIPCTENMPAGNAYRPGDVISSMSGKTIEIITTDAEGRLLLADAITYAQKLGATQIIDVATLTGACVVALGSVTSGLITNNTAFCQKLSDAASQAGEKMWILPNFPEYKEQIKSTIADLKNSGGRMAGAITAGSFIEEFTNNLPWVHIDIAGTADGDKEHGYHVKGATGAATRTLIQLAQNLSAK